MILDDLGPILDTGSRITIILATVVVSFRLLNATYNNSQATWQQATATLTESTTYAKAETAELRARVDHLEDDARAYSADRAAWLLERADLQARIQHLERDVTRLTEELATVTGDRHQPKGETHE